MTLQAQLIGGAVLAIVLALVVWYFWPVSPPSTPSDDRLKTENAELVETNKQLLEVIAGLTEAAVAQRNEANAEIEKIPALRERRRAARRDGASRTSALLATPDDGALDALRAQHARTRSAIERVRSAGGGAEGGDAGPPPR